MRRRRIDVGGCSRSRRRRWSSPWPASAGRREAKPSAVQGGLDLVGPHNDGGWSQAHDDGMDYVQKMLGNKVQTTYKENIAVGAQFSQTVASLVAQGYKMIFATSYGYVTPALAAKYPNVLFEQATGTYEAKNVSEYFGAAEDTVFLSGMAAGAASKTGNIGYVVAYPDPRGDPARGRLRARRAADPSGCEGAARLDEQLVRPADGEEGGRRASSRRARTCSARTSTRLRPVQFAESIKMPWVGYDSDSSKFAPKSWLTASVYNWGPYYLKRVKEAMAGTWKSGFYYGSIKDGFTKLAPFGPGVSRGDEGGDRGEGEGDRERHLLRVRAGRSTTRPARSRVPEGQAADDPAALLDQLARQGRDRQPEGLAVAWAIRQRAQHRHGRPVGGGRGDARDHEALPRRRRERRASTSRRPRGRCTRCSARTAPARARSRTSSPGSTAPTKARSCSTGSRVEFATPAGRARRRHLDGPPALSPRRALHRRREHRARRARGARAARSGSSRAGSRRRSRELSSATASPSTRVRAIWQLSLGEQQRVEILKALYRDARILILDEPTAVLTPQEAAALFATLRQMAEDGRTVIFISHKLNEVMAVSDRVTVLRGGRSVATVATAEATPRSLADADGRPRAVHGAEAARWLVAGEPCSSCEDLWAPASAAADAVKGVSLAVRARRDRRRRRRRRQRPARARRDDRRAQAADRRASIRVAGPPSVRGDPRAALAAGVAYVPEDRLGTGRRAGARASPRTSCSSPTGSRPSRTGRCFGSTGSGERAVELIAATGSPRRDPRRRRACSRAATSRRSCSPASSPARRSGRRRLADPGPRRRCGRDGRTLPPRGGGGRRRGAVFSEDLEEILELADRIAVIYEGRIVGEVLAAEARIEEIGLLMAGGRPTRAGLDERRTRSAARPPRGSAGRARRGALGPRPPSRSGCLRARPPSSRRRSGRTEREAPSRSPRPGRAAARPGRGSRWRSRGRARARARPTGSSSTRRSSGSG